MSRLPVEVLPRHDESASGFMLRTLAANGANPGELLAWTRRSARRQLAPEDAPLLSVLTGVGVGWFNERIPAEVRRDRWTEIDVFGCRWRSDWAMRGQHCQVCCRCLLEFRYARLEWDLTAYVACPIHRELLIDRCGACGRALTPNRPAVDVCRCGSFIDCPTAVTMEVDALIVDWCAWLSGAARAAMAAAPCPSAPADGLGGLSTDGAFRLILALGRGMRELRGLHRHSASPWLSTRGVHDVLLSGLTSLKELDAGRTPDLRKALRCGDALSEQSVRGITAFDRQTAGSMLTKLKLPSRWRNAKPALHAQGDLFES